MNKKQKLLKEKEVYSSYHIPSMPHYMKRPKCAIYINPSNSLEHEILKLKTCYDLQSNGSKYITEAMRNTKDKKGKDRRVDIVDISSGKEFEVEMEKRRAKRFEGEKGVIVIKGWENTEQSQTD